MAPALTAAAASYPCRWKNLTRTAKTATSPPTSAVKVLEVSSATQRPNGSWPVAAPSSAAGGAGLEHPGCHRGGTLSARADGHRGQRCRYVSVEAAGRGQGGRVAEVPDADALIGHDDGVTAERPVGDTGLAQPQHGQQGLL